MAHLTETVSRLTALCALSASIEILLPESAKKKGVRFILGLTALFFIARAAAALFK